MSPISGDVKPRARWWSLAALFTFGALMIPMAFAFAGQINPDGIVYVRIARYYLSGDLGRAVSGYWSPLYSWLLVPWLVLGVPGLLATKLLAAVLALTWVVAVSRLGRAYLKTMVGRRCLVISAAASVLPWSMEVISPDLLLAVLLTFYFAVVLNPEMLEKPRRAFASGVLGGLAFLAKAYAFPFFIAHFFLTVVLHAWTHPEPRALRRAGVVFLTGILGFLLVAAPWVSVLSAKYGTLTITTAASRRNIPGAVVFGEGHTDRSPFPPGVKLAPVADGRLTAWEAPDEVNVPTIGPSASASGGIVKLGRGQVILSNLIVIRDELLGFDYFHLALGALLATAFIGFLRGPTRVDGSRCLWGFATGSLYVIGYLPLWARESRYYWPIVGLLMVISFGVVEQIVPALTQLATRADGRPRQDTRWLVVGALVVSLSYVQVGLHSLQGQYRARADFVGVATQLREEAARNGSRLTGPLAGNDWPRTVYLAYLLNQPSYGSTTTEEPERLAQELASLGIHTYFVFDSQPLVERLKQSNSFRILADQQAPSAMTRGTVAAFEVSHQQTGR